MHEITSRRDKDTSDALNGLLKYIGLFSSNLSNEVSVISWGFDLSIEIELLEAHKWVKVNFRFFLCGCPQMSVYKILSYPFLSGMHVLDVH